VREFVPPLLAVPFLPSHDTYTIVVIVVKDVRSIEKKDVKKRIIVEDVDRRSRRTVARDRTTIIHKLKA